MRPWALAALDLVFPAFCPACEAPLGAGRRDPLCGPCWSRIVRVLPPLCDPCGLPLPTSAPTSAADATESDACDTPRPWGGRTSAADAAESDACDTPRPWGGLEGAWAPSNRKSCLACLVDPPPFRRARGAALYTGPLRDALHALKFRGKRALARPLAELVYEQCEPLLTAGADALVPVPLARARLAERGFNQAELVAERLGGLLHIPVRRGWLSRVRDTAPQTELPAAERRANVRGAFAASRRVLDRHVILVDDVLTTGATARECARVLRAAGARQVDLVTIARVAMAA